MIRAPWWWTTRDVEPKVTIPTGPPVIDPATTDRIIVYEGDEVDLVVDNVGYYAMNWIAGNLPPGLRISEFDGLSCRITGTAAATPPAAQRAEVIPPRSGRLLTRRKKGRRSP